jgi:hypothetical protein
LSSSAVVTPGRAAARVASCISATDPLLLVPLEQRRGLAVVQVEPALDRLFGVVLALDHLATADVAHPADQWGLGDRVVGAAVDAHPPCRQALEHLLGRHLEIHDQVEGCGVQRVVEHLCLGEGSGAAVEDESPGAHVGFGEPALDHLHHQVVGHQLALVHEGLHPPPQRCAALDFGTQHVAGRHVRHHVVVREPQALRALAGTLFAQNDEPDPGVHRRPT